MYRKDLSCDIYIIGDQLVTLLCINGYLEKWHGRVQGRGEAVCEP